VTEVYDIIKRYCCDSSWDHGLMLIDSPTGSGKTYEVLNFIYDFCADEQNKDTRVFFTSSFKKNLPVTSLKERFRRNGKVDEFESKFIFVNSVMETLVDRFTEHVYDEMPEDIRNASETRKLYNNLEAIRKNRSASNGNLPIDPETIKEIEALVRTYQEPEFRRMVQKKLERIAPSVPKRLKRVKTDREWAWVGTLYPDTFIRDKQIIFLSMDKLLARVATPLEPSYTFYDSGFLDNSILFIDEFDATKATMLKHAVDEGLFGETDYVNLFNQVSRTIREKTFPRDLTTQSEKQRLGKYGDRPLDDIIENLRSICDEKIRDYHLDCNYKTDDASAEEELKNNFIFHDYRFRMILNADKSYISTRYDQERKVNVISFVKGDSENAAVRDGRARKNRTSENKTGDNETNITEMLRSLRGFSNYFMTAVSILANNYRELKEERQGPGAAAFTTEDAVRSVLADFNVPQEYITDLTGQIMLGMRGKNRTEGDEFDLSVYQRGFRYFSIENDSTHDTMSKVNMFSFSNTPEKMLLSLCTKAKVVGISATATIPTVIANFDISYLRSKLGDFFVSLTPDEEHRLAAKFKNSTSGYDKVNIRSKLLGIRDIKNEYKDELWNEVFSNLEYVGEVTGTLNLKLGMNGTSFHKERYRRIALAFREFILHDDIKSFLCILNTHPKEGDKGLDIDVLKDKIFKRICEDCNVDYSPDLVFRLKGTGGEFERNKENLLELLAAGKKVFAISVYQTMGAGQNLQYPMPESMPEALIKINDFPARAEKDFDAIYLDKPTNVLVNVNGNELRQEDLIRYIYQLEFLQEVGEISQDELYNRVKDAFIKYAGTKNNQFIAAPSLYTRSSYKYAATRTLIQAVGRICRTNMKNRNVYVYGAADLTDAVVEKIDDRLMLNPEFTVLLEECRRAGCLPAEQSDLKDRAGLISMRFNTLINGMLKGEWSDRDIEIWKSMREFALKNPTLPLDMLQNDVLARNAYVELPKKQDYLYYKQEWDFNRVEISFSKNDECRNEVSAASARLEMLFSIPGVREFFERRGYATEFTPEFGIMSPTMFNNIYKGALGETVGRFIFENHMHIALKEIGENRFFEKFDYRICGKSIYVDFKHWKEYSDHERDREIEDIRDKMSKIDCRAVLIVNLLSENEGYRITETEIDGKKIYTIPYLYSVKEAERTSLIEPARYAARFNVEALEKVLEVTREYE